MLMPLVSVFVFGVVLLEVLRTHHSEEFLDGGKGGRTHVLLALVV